MLPPYIILEKKVGQTPLQAIEELRASQLELASVPATYAGRLDPMASGKLLILLGDECKHREQYTALDKEYEIEVVFGIKTDTADALGMPQIDSDEASTNPSRRSLLRACKAMLGSHTVPYPAFSSKTVNGIPLFQYALEGKLNEIDIPKHSEKIYSIQISNLSSVSGSELLERIQSHLARVPRTHEPSKELGADFRQDAIREAWAEVLQKYSHIQFGTATLKVTCASGTYMRTLAERLGHELGTTGFALSIHRARIGRYRKFGRFGFWTKRY